MNHAIAHQYFRNDVTSKIPANRASLLTSHSVDHGDDVDFEGVSHEWSCKFDGWRHDLYSSAAALWAICSTHWSGKRWDRIVHTVIDHMHPAVNNSSSNKPCMTSLLHSDSSLTHSAWLGGYCSIHLLSETDEEATKQWAGHQTTGTVQWTTRLIWDVVWFGRPCGDSSRTRSGNETPRWQSERVSSSIDEARMTSLSGPRSHWFLLQHVTGKLMIQTMFTASLASWLPICQFLGFYFL
jgi:hypothetical protein